MDIGIEANGFVILAIIGVLGAALIAGGIVLYRSGPRARFRAFGSASVAAGTVMWAIVLVSAPASSSTSGEARPEADTQDGPISSAVCAPGFPDCEDTIVVPSGEGETGDELDGEVLPPNDRIGDTSGDVPSIDPQIETEPSIGINEPHPLPNTSDPNGPAPCDPDGSVSITSDGKIDCLAPIQVDPLPPVETPTVEDSVGPVEAPTIEPVEPGDADESGREVPIGMFDQDGDSEPSAGSNTSEDAPVADGVVASSASQ